MKEWNKHLENKKKEKTDEISELRIGDDNGSLMSIYAMEDKINEIIDFLNKEKNDDKMEQTPRN